MLREVWVLLEKYILAEIEVIEFDSEDVITTSNFGDPEDYVKSVQGSDLPDDWNWSEQSIYGGNAYESKIN